MDRVSSCNIYAVQQDTQSVLFITYVSSTCFGPHRSIIRSVLCKLYLQIWYVVIRVLLDTSSRYKVVTAHRSIVRSVLQAVFADFVRG